MKIKKTKFKNTFIINHKKKLDKRGYFMRGYCEKELKKIGVNFKIKQSNYSFNKEKFTFRGFHYQTAPYSESKIINCVSGKLLLLLVNIDKKSPNYLKKLKFILDSDMNKSILIFKDCATAFLTLESRTLVHYYMSSFFKNGKAQGLNYMDPKIKINLPNKPKVISKRDLSFKYL